MKRKIKSIINKFPKLFMSLLMLISCIHLNGTQVNALSFLPEAKASVNVLAEGINVPHLGNTANMYEIKIGGQDAFCLAHSKKMSSRYYVAKTSQQVDPDIKQVLNWYKSALSNGYDPAFTRGIVQGTIWAIQSGVVNDEKKLADIYETMFKYFITTNLDGLTGIDIVNTYYKHNGLFPAILDKPKTGDYPIWKDGSSAQQPVVLVGTPTYTDLPVPEYDEVTASKNYSIQDQVVLNINKTDVDTGKGLSNVEFDLYRDGQKIATVKTNSLGQASYVFEKTYSKTGTATEEYIANKNDFHTTLNQNKLPSGMFDSRASALASAEKKALAQAKAEVEKLLKEPHSYKAVETNTKEAYYLQPSSTTQSQDYATNDGTGSVTFSFKNKRQLGTVNITKLDSETNNPVDTAIYGLYAKNNIVHPDGHTGVLYHANDLVGTFPQTNTQGKSTLNNLYLGEYYVKELTAPHGYLENTKKYDVTLSYAGQTASVTDASATVDDTVQRAEVSIIKKDKELSEGKDANIFDNNKDHAQGDASIIGATYGLYAREDIIHADGTIGVVQI